MTKRDSRSIMRDVLVPKRRSQNSINEDYGAVTIGSQADAGNTGIQQWAGSNQFDTSAYDSSSPFNDTVRALNEYQSGNLGDSEILDMFTQLIDTGLIEYMNDDIRKTAESLVQSGYIHVMTEAEFKRDTSDQEAQKGTPNFNLNKSTQYKTNKAASVSDIGNAKGQQAQASPANVPAPPKGYITSIGYQKFPDSGGTSENPPKVPNPQGSQKAGPNHSDGMSGGGTGINVGKSLQQGLDADKGDYEGSKVGEVKEGKRRRLRAKRRRL